MIVMQLQGGLGNQMFQYACGRAVALRTGKKLILDLSHYLNKSQQRQYYLHYMNIQARTVQSMDELKMLANAMGIMKIGIFKEAQFHFDPRVLALKDDVILADGYWQSEKYFYDVAENIRTDFTPRLGSISEEGLHMGGEMQNAMSVAVHVRHGDYITNPTFAKVHGVLSMDYYIKAISVIRSIYQDVHCYIFSDDIKWCRNAFKYVSNMSIIEHTSVTNDHEDLWLMSQCKHNIIANSSYSWWGAWLNNHPEKIIVAPQYWFADAPHNTMDLLPSKWIRL
jgi:hypothetical protein